jgi:hypothetical protein
MGRRLFTFPRLIAIALGILLLAAIGLALFRSPDSPRQRLSGYLSWKIPETVSVTDHKFFNFEKDPRWYWSLSHPSDALDGLLSSGFRIRDQYELVAMQRELADVFQGTFTPSESDRVYYNEINRRSVVLLFKSSGTTSYVAVYSR